MDTNQDTQQNTSQLSEMRRTQLDEIVKQMTTNKESDKAIQMVVDDFKSKYQNEEAYKHPVYGQDHAGNESTGNWFQRNILQPVTKGIVTAGTRIGQAITDPFVI